MIDPAAFGLSEDAALFYNVDGIPASIGLASYPGCVAWDEIPPRPFCVESLQRNGWMIGFDEFLCLVNRSDLE